MLEKLEKAMAEHADMLTDEEIQLGNKILLYISCCLCGRAYPIGTLEPQQAKLVSEDVFRCLISLRGKDGSNGTLSLSLSTFVLLALICNYFSFSVNHISVLKVVAQVRCARVSQCFDDVVASSGVLRR